MQNYDIFMYRQLVDLWCSGPLFPKVTLGNTGSCTIIGLNLYVDEGHGRALLNEHRHPSEHETLTHCWVIVGPASKTVGQH